VNRDRILRAPAARATRPSGWGEAPLGRCAAPRGAVDCWRIKSSRGTALHPNERWPALTGTDDTRCSIWIAQPGRTPDRAMTRSSAWPTVACPRVPSPGVDTLDPPKRTERRRGTGAPSPTSQCSPRPWRTASGSGATAQSTIRSQTGAHSAMPRQLTEIVLPKAFRSRSDVPISDVDASNATPAWYLHRTAHRERGSSGKGQG
jgi:hypothetical protein